jgi:hypothetical protein
MADASKDDEQLQSELAAVQPKPFVPSPSLVPENFTPPEALATNQAQGMGEAAATLPQPGEVPQPAPEPGVVTTTNAAGQPMQVALAGLSPEAQQRYLAMGPPGDRTAESIRISGPIGGPPADLPRYSGMGDIRRVEARANRLESQDAHAMADAADAQKRAVQAQSDLLQTRAKEEYTLQSQAQDQARKVEADNQAWQANHTAALQHAESAYNDAVTAQKNMTFDPGRFERNMSVGANLQTALSVALGGIGQALIPGSRNVGLDQLHRAVEADVASQQEAYRRAGNNVQMADNAYSRLRQQGFDHEHAVAAAKNSVWEMAKTGLNVLGAKYRAPEAVANAQATMAQIDQEQAKNKTVFDQGAVARATQFANMRHGERQFAFAQDQAAWQRGQQQMEMEVSSRAAQQKALSAGKDREIEGWTGGAKTDAMYNKATEMAGTYQTLAPLFDKMAQWRKQHSGGTMTNMGEAVAEADAMHSEALLEVKNLGELGVLTGDDVKIVHQIIGPPPHAFFTTDKAYAAKMKEAQSFLKQKTEAKMKAWGYHPTDAANPIAPIRGGNMQPD